MRTTFKNLRVVCAYKTLSFSFMTKNLLYIGESLHHFTGYILKYIRFSTNNILYGIKLGTLICDRVLMDRCSFSHNKKKTLKSDFLLTLLKKVKFCSSEDANVLKSYCMQYFKKPHKILFLSDENKYFF